VVKAESKRPVGRPGLNGRIILKPILEQLDELE
jgi:hypothetical protein